ncbi:MAG: divergent polysaccharide deacetylase family protein [Deltaproteobacteria bacterium]|nr:divergent polysaccharide deacetylase family protein [Deltaproteobacteria bacterium]
MKLFKKLFTATVISLIVILIAGIIYILQFKEEPPAIKEQKKETKQIETKKAIKLKGEKSNLFIPKPARKRQVAIIVDDIGNDINPVRELLKVNADLTFAVLPFQTHTREAAEMFHKAKREILLHLPMEPVSYPNEKPGEGALFTDMNDEEIIFQLKKNIAAVPYISGVNNHMGSKFMEDEKELVLIFNELKKRKLFFVDSRTSVDTKAVAAADRVGLKIAERKIFLDKDRDYNKIYNNLINITKNDDISPVIAIGHPYPETIRAIKDAMKVLRDNGVSIVPVSKIVTRKKS